MAVRRRPAQHAAWQPASRPARAAPQPEAGRVRAGPGTGVPAGGVHPLQARLLV
jgi:hypothetical protein